MNCNIDELSMLQNNAETNKKLKLENQKQVLTAILDALSIYHLLLSKDKYKGVNIGTIISSRKRKYKLGTLSKEDEIILRNLGETFEDKRIVKTFEEMLAIISEYLVNTGKKYKDIKYDDVYKRFNIGKWKYSRRNEYRLGKLDKEKEMKLRQHGEDFEINEIIPFEY